MNMRRFIVGACATLVPLAYTTQNAEAADASNLVQTIRQLNTTINQNLNGSEIPQSIVSTQDNTNTSSTTPDVQTNRQLNTTINQNLNGSDIPQSIVSTQDNIFGTNIQQALPLVLKEQGTFYVGGTVEFRNPNTSSTTPDPRSLPGSIAVHQMYVEYQIPLLRRYKYPIVFMHGGGHTGEFFRTTPDGRQGWFTSFTRRGFAVYSVDGSNRGRAGWDPTNRFAVSQGLLPYTALESANMYSEESAWVAFRWGPSFGTPYANTQFPLDHVNDYLKEIQPAYRDANANPNLQGDLEALVDKIGPCILLGWSTGTGNVMVAATSSPARIQNVKGIIGIEGYPGAAGNRPPDADAAKVPFLGLNGDFLDPAPFEAYAALLRALGGDATSVHLPDIGIFGNGHTMAIEKNDEQIADVIEQWIKKHVSP
jgi:pimeloyl-ACP methyl ester carboxylesterase